MVKNKPLCIELPQMNDHVRIFDKIKSMFFMIYKWTIVKKYNGILNKMINAMQKRFISIQFINKEIIK